MSDDLTVPEQALIVSLCSQVPTWACLGIANGLRLQSLAQDGITLSEAKLTKLRLDLVTGILADILNVLINEPENLRKVNVHETVAMAWEIEINNVVLAAEAKRTEAKLGLAGGSGQQLSIADVVPMRRS